MPSPLSSVLALLYLEGMLITSVGFVSEACPACYGLTDSWTYYFHLLLHSVFWPASMVQLLRTGSIIVFLKRHPFSVAFPKECHEGVFIKDEKNTVPIQTENIGVEEKKTEIPISQDENKKKTEV